MKKAERDHYGVLFRVNKDNLKKTWAIIKEVINKTKLVHILNLSILQGVFPSVFKTACVIPIYKGDNNMIICNYRPVSVLRVFSKIFERILYSRLFNFITKQNILYTFYRKAWNEICPNCAHR